MKTFLLSILSIISSTFLWTEVIMATSFINNTNAINVSCTTQDVSCFGLNDGVISIKASGGNGTYTYSIDNGTTWQSSSSFNNVTAGQYIISVKDLVDGNKSTDVSVILNEPASLSLSYAIVHPDCNNKNGEIIIIASGGAPNYTYQWNHSLETSPEVNNLNGGTYTATVVDANECSTTDNILLNTPIMPKIEAKSSTCDGTTELNADLPDDAEGNWYIEMGSALFSDFNSPSVNASSLSPGENRIVWKVRYEDGCEYKTETTITNNQPSKAYAGYSFDVCKNSALLNAQAPPFGTGEWSVINGQAKFEDLSDPKTFVSNIMHGNNTYRWTVKNNGCISSDEITVNNGKVDVFGGLDHTICTNQLQLNADPSPSGCTGNWSVVAGKGSGTFQPSSINPNATVYSLSYGSNELVWNVNNNGCISRDTITVINDAPYNVNATPRIVTEETYTTLTAERPIIGQGRWSLMEGRGIIDNVNDPITRVNNLFKNVNIFRWTVSNNSCSEYLNVEIEVVSDVFTNLQSITQKNQVTMYPSPVRDQLTIESDVNIEIVKVYTLSGELQIQKKFNSSKIKVQLAKLNAGIYLIKIYNEKGSCITKKISKY